MRLGSICAVLGMLLAGPVAAQPAGEADQRAQTMIDNAKVVFGEQRARASCAKEDPDEIVVCLDRPKDQRVQSTAQSDPFSRAARKALDGNIPSAPDVSSIKCKRGADGVCRGNFGNVPPPAYMIDVTALPAAPEGSDADRIAKGEMTAP